MLKQGFYKWNFLRGDFRKFMELQNTGLCTEKKCTRCRFQGAISQEQEEQVIKDSVWIDLEEKKVMAYPALKADPKENLRNNKFIIS